MTAAGALRFLFWTASTGGLICLATYAALAYQENKWLYSLLSSSGLSFKERSFLIAGALAFVFCMFAGAQSSLQWLPASWGHIDEDGHFVPIAVTFAGLFALFVGVMLLRVIERGTRYARDLEALVTEIDELEKELRKAKTGDGSVR